MNKNSNIKQGERIRKEILKRLPNTPYGLSRELDRNPATILHHLKILQKQGMVRSVRKEKNGRINTIYYIIRVNEKKNEIILSKELFEVDNASKIHGYALSGSTFGISIDEKAEWDRIAIWKQELSYNVNENTIKIKIPEKIMNFYEIPFNSILPSYNEKKNYVLFSFY
ncbi:MAG: ArsR/SmtB family transcription factor [Candidatus Helarchaeales archaeon]